MIKRVKREQSPWKQYFWKEYFWSKNTTLIVGNSMITGVDERMISRKGRVVKVRYFSGQQSRLCMII